MAFVCRSADYRHQVLEISPPVPVHGETAAALGRCVAAMDTAIRANPAHWFFWFKADDLAALGLIDQREPHPEAQARDRAGWTGELQKSTR
jgi:hypothetical protein